MWTTCFAPRTQTGCTLEDPEGRRRYDRWRKKTIYRGGVGDPAYIAIGLSWTLDFKTAQWFARVYGDPTPEAPGHVITARVPKGAVLACYEHEDEVVVVSNDQRPFKVVDTGWEQVPTPWANQVPTV